MRVEDVLPDNYRFRVRPCVLLGGSPRVKLQRQVRLLGHGLWWETVDEGIWLDRDDETLEQCIEQAKSVLWYSECWRRGRWEEWESIT